jgi:hypothetical protein
MGWLASGSSGAERFRLDPADSYPQTKPRNTGSISSMKPQSERAIIQVAHVVRDLEKAIHAYSRVFEVGPWDVYTFAPPVLRESMYLGKPSDHT